MSQPPTPISPTTRISGCCPDVAGTAQREGRPMHKHTVHHHERTATVERPRPTRGRSRRRRRAPAQAAAAAALRRAAHGHPRHHGRQRRHAGHRQGPRHRRQRHRLDDHQLLADLRQPAAAGRARRRPARPPPDVPLRTGHLRHRFTGRRARRGRRDAVRCSRRPGSRRRAALARCAVDSHEHLPAGHAANPRAGRLGRRRWRRRRRRRASWRRPHRVARLAGDLLHQPPDRHRARHRRAPG